jgi:hypothetical protein
MSLELTDGDLAEIKTTVVWQLSASRVEYRRLRAVIAEQLPGVTQEGIEAAKMALLSGAYRDGGQAADHATFCCGLYLLVCDCASYYATLIEEGRASAEVIRNLIVMAPQAWGALGALAMMLNGSPLAQSFIDQQIGQHRSASAAHAADSRHGQPGGNRDKQNRIRQIWASGKYTSRDRCAEEECGALGMSLSSARKALRNTPEPSR